MPALLILAWLCAAGLLLPADASAAEDASVSATDVPPAAPDPSGRDRDAIRYRVEIVAPAELRELLSQNLDLVRWQAYEGMTDDLLDRLVRDAVAQSREAAATLGYFSATVDAKLARGDPLVVTLAIEPGSRVEVSDVDIDVVGAATGDPKGAEQIRRLREEWLLPRGAPWTQTGWDQAKQQAIATLTTGPWAAARIMDSEARVDPAHAAAALTVAIDSGPPFRYGHLDVRGLSRYPASLVENFATLEPGGLYDSAEIDQLTRRLAGSGYFSSVQATIEADPAKAERAPVQVAVIEARTRKFEAGVGYSTDTQYRANASYSDVDIDDRALQFYVDGRIEQKVQGASLRFVRPPTPTHWRDTFGTAWLRTDIENLITTTASVTARRVAIDERNQRAYGAGFFVDEQRPQGEDTIRSHALYVDVQQTWRRVDDLLAPTRGYIVDVDIGGGIPGASTRAFARVLAQVAGFHPLRRDVDFTARATLGLVGASARDGIPSLFLFRTGGDTTVRGYAFESIGVKRGDATVGGRYELVTSAEVTRWIRPVWGIAAFVDAGNATDRIGELAHLSLGYGLGLRLRTPIGPFRFDVAYGQEDHSVRLHFSVGVRF